MNILACVVLPNAQYKGREKMTFKFDKGQSVEYKPAGGKIGLFEVTRRMPEEFRAIDRKYRIKCVGEGFERIVLECDLSPANEASSYASVPQNVRVTSRR